MKYNQFYFIEIYVRYTYICHIFLCSQLISIFSTLCFLLQVICLRSLLHFHYFFKSSYFHWLLVKTKVGVLEGFQDIIFFICDQLVKKNEGGQKRERAFKHFLALNCSLKHCIPQLLTVLPQTQMLLTVRWGEVNEECKIINKFFFHCTIIYNFFCSFKN